MIKVSGDARQNPVQEMPPEYSWTTAAGMKRSSLARHLCDPGRASKGEACKACEVRCAFGRHYLGIKDPEYKFQKIKRQTRRVVQAYQPDGTMVGEWDTVIGAAKSLGINKHKISVSINHGTTYHGMRWRWMETEE